MYFAGNPAKPIDEEFDLMVHAWALTLQNSVPEHRLSESIAEARRTRSSNFTLEPAEVWAAWERIKASERAVPPLGTYDWRARDVCSQCNGTGTRRFTKRDPILGRDCVYGEACYHD